MTRTFKRDNRPEKYRGGKSKHSRGGDTKTRAKRSEWHSIRGKTKAALKRGEEPEALPNRRSWQWL